MANIQEKDTGTDDDPISCAGLVALPSSSNSYLLRYQKQFCLFHLLCVDQRPVEKGEEK